MSNLKENTVILQDILKTLNDKGYIINLQERNIIPTNNSQNIVADEGFDGLNLANIEGDENLVPENLRIGTNIFGIEGTFVRDYAFEDAFITGKKISTYTNERVKNIGPLTFRSCTSLTSVSFPNCTTIGNAAFYKCTSLTSVEFPACTSINLQAFQRCTSLTSVEFPACTSIDFLAFQSCTSLTSVNFPNCTSIGYSAFETCTSLASVSFPNCTKIGKDAFESCTSLASVSFPSCTNISGGAFRNCRSLTSVDFPNCTYIGNEAFWDCWILSTVSFPNCTYIASSAFYYCTSLASVSFPNCTTIGLQAFGGGCTSLTSAYFGYSTVSKTAVIYPQAFYRCTNLTNLTLCYPSVATLSNINAFNSTPMSVSTLTGSFGSIYVPASLVAAYKSATNWATYADRITAIVE